jgi:hypothetical protein
LSIHRYDQDRNDGLIEEYVSQEGSVTEDEGNDIAQDEYDNDSADSLGGDDDDSEVE